LGKIPEEWEVCVLSDLVDFVKGVEPGSKNYQSRCGDGMVPFLRVGDLGKRESAIFVNCELVNDRVLTPEDIAVTMDGTIGLVRIGLQGAYSSGIRRIVIRKPKRIGWAFVYQLLQSEYIQAIIHAHAKGTTIKHASSSIDHMIFALPNSNLVENFEKDATPLLKQALCLARRNEVLECTRDLLLPKLISGELDVSEVDITIPEASA
jgi:type I restriction enzyme S subunit